MKTIKKYKYLGINLLLSEYDQFEKAFKTSICRSLSEYGRKLVLGKPVTVIYRNRSEDDLVDACADLKKALEETLNIEPGFSLQDKERLFQQVSLIKELLIKINDHVCCHKNIRESE